MPDKLIIFFSRLVMVQHMEGTPQRIDSDREVSEQNDVHIASESTGEEAPLTESLAPEANHEVANDDVKIDENELRLESNKTTRESSELSTNSEVESDDDYDPETAFTSTEVSANNTINDGEKSVSRETQSGHIDANAEEENDDSYDPEATLPPVPARYHGSGLPPKPTIVADHCRIDIDPHLQFRAAYEAVMRSTLVKSETFQALTELEQKKTILGELVKRKVKLVAGLTPEIIDRMNYDQIYSFNEPTLLWNHTIPLIPYNEYCRRPNLTIPMSEDEEREYNEFLKHQAAYTSSFSRPQGEIRLFVGNLPAKVSAKDLYRIFSQYGKLHEIADRSLFAFVHFYSEADCREAIKGEHDVPLFGRYWRLNATTANKGKQYLEERRGRERSVEEAPSDVKRQKVDVKERDMEVKQQQTNDGSIHCQIFVTNESSAHYTEKLKRLFSDGSITFQVEDIEDEDLSELISEVAYSGVRSACIVKEHAVDLQVFEKTNDDGIRFDEYAGIEPAVAVEVIQNSYSKSTTVEPAPEPIPEPMPEPAPKAIYQSIKKDRRGNDNNSRVKSFRNAALLRSGAPKGHKTLFADMYGPTTYSPRQKSYSPSLDTNNQAQHPQAHQGRPIGMNQHTNVSYPQPNQYHHQTYQNMTPGLQNTPIFQSPSVQPFGAPPQAQYAPPSSVDSSISVATTPYQSFNQVQPSGQTQLLHALQNLDPTTMQQMIMFLQQQQQQPQQQLQQQPLHQPLQQPQQPQPPQAPQSLQYQQAVQQQVQHNLASNVIEYAPTSLSIPSTQVNTLLAQLQTDKGYEPSSPQLKVLHDTLAKLSKQ